MIGVPAEGGALVERLAAELPEWCWPPPAAQPSSAEGPAAASGREPAPIAEGPFVWQPDRAARPGPGPLGGMRLAVKDLVAVAGRPLRAGSASRAGVGAEPAHAPVVAGLLNLGARLVGTTRLHELGFGVTGINRFEGTVANPVDGARIPGGSSSGSAAAVALGLADVAIATDTGGSARIPAALCGVVGYKASRRLPTDGVLPLAPTLDHLGWCTASAAGAMWVASSLGLLASSPPQGPPRIGVLTAAAETASPEVREPFDAAIALLARSGMEVVGLDWPHGDLVYAVSTTIMFAEAARAHLGGLDEDPTGHGEDVQARLERGRTISAVAYLAAMTLKDHLSQAFSPLLHRVDVVACPTTPVPAPLITAVDDPAVAATLVRNTRLENLTGRPAISLPLPLPAAGLPAPGLPAALHLAGRTDGDLLGYAITVERVLGSVTQPR